MSPRQSVDRDRIREFFKRLSGRFHGSARVYLVGGTSLVFEEMRDQTLDIDVVLEVSPNEHGDLIRAIRELKDALATNVEEASPGDFIPLPSGYGQRHHFLERFGGIDVFHFDLYSTALSKIERGRTQDYEDVVALLAGGNIRWDRLAACFDEILPQMGLRSLKQNPAGFERNFRTLQGMWDERREQA